MRVTAIVLSLLFLFFSFTLLSGQTATNTGNGNPGTNASPAASVSPVPSVTPSVSPTPTVTPVTQPTTPPKPDIAVAKIPSSNGWAVIDFLGSDATDTNKLGLKVRYKNAKDSEPETKTFLVDNPDLKTVLSKFGEGDQVTIEYTKENGVEKLKSIDVVSFRTGAQWPISIAFIIGFPILCIVVFKKFMLGEDGLYSKSKFQIFIWFLVLITVYIAVNILRVYFGGAGFVGGVSIPTNLLLLSGLSSITFVGAKAIKENKPASSDTSTNTAAASDAASNNPPNVDTANVNAENIEEDKKALGQDVSTSIKHSSFFYDIFHGDRIVGMRNIEKMKLDAGGNRILDKDGEPVMESIKVPVRNLDLGDFQMIVLTMLAVVVYVVQAIYFAGNIELHQMVTLPDVDSTILAAFGLGHGAYLVKKLSEN